MQNPKGIEDLEQLALETAADFDRVAALRAGDEALIARAAGRALAASYPRAGRSRARRPAFVAGLASAFIASGALAGWWVEARRGESKPSPVPVSSVPALTVAKAATPSRSLASQNRETPDSAVEPSSGIATPIEHSERTPTGKIDARRSGSEPRSASPPPAVWDPATLFREANRARGAGALDRAMELYGRLQREYPASDEAQVATIALGKLLLARGQAAEADRQFTRYLDGGGRALREEALIGRAHSLLRMGRLRDERAILSLLVREFPRSVYAPYASKRLLEP